MYRAKPIAFVPGKVFPSISITGTMCWLNCLYCMGYYLESMLHVNNPQQLYFLIKNLVKKGVKGILLSGGFTREGYLPIEPYLPIIKEIKKNFNIIISVHTGFIDKDKAIKLREAGVDIVDYEIVLDEHVIKYIKHLNKTPEDYMKTYEILLKYGPEYIAPHVPIGFRETIESEYYAVDVLRSFNPYIIIFLVFIPTRNTPLYRKPVPSAEDIVDVISYARMKLPSYTEIALGCMRPWSIRFVVDDVLVNNELIDRIVNPPKNIVKKYRLKIVNACCSVPRRLLHLFEERNIHVVLGKE